MLNLCKSNYYIKQWKTKYFYISRPGKSLLKLPTIYVKRNKAATNRRTAFLNGCLK